MPPLPVRVSPRVVPSAFRSDPARAGCGRPGGVGVSHPIRRQALCGRGQRLEPSSALWGRGPSPAGVHGHGDPVSK